MGGDLICACWRCWGKAALKEVGDGGMPGSIVCRAFVECDNCGLRGPSFQEEWRPGSLHKHRAMAAWCALMLLGVAWSFFKGFCVAAGIIGLIYLLRL